MLNKVILIGRLGKDPETRLMPNGEAVCNFSVATSESWKDQSGQRQERTEWHNIKKQPSNTGMPKFAMLSANA